ncbi:MAG: hypothetical protein AB7N71_04170 [Phycisphaerae bacterium]
MTSKQLHSSVHENQCRPQLLALLVGLGLSGIVVGQSVHNVTQRTDHVLLQDALNAAANGDVIEIDAGTLFEDNIVFPTAIEVTIRGAGRDLTFIDGGGGDDEFPILNMQGTQQTNATVISDLALINGVNTVLTGGGAIRLTNASPVFRNVDFVNSRGPRDGAGAAHLLANIGASPRFENCAFLAGSSAFDNIGLNDGATTLINCLVVADATATAFKFSRGEHKLINCTIVARTTLNRAIGSFEGANVTVQNTIIQGRLTRFGDDSQINTTRCLFEGATDDNVDGLATFVNAEALDFGLAAGSLGIDAGDNSLLPDGVMSDILGLSRIVDDPDTADSGREGCPIIDIGAFEFQSFTDSDEDGIEDGCDVCFGDNDSGDADNDGVCDDRDVCNGDDASGDADNDGICDDLDTCTGDDTSGDSDNDGLCDNADPCPNGEDLLDSDADGVNDCEDEFPDDPFDGRGDSNNNQNQNNNAGNDNPGNDDNQNDDDGNDNAGNVDNQDDAGGNDNALDENNQDNDVNDDSARNDEGILPALFPCGFGTLSGSLLSVASLFASRIRNHKG